MLNVIGFIKKKSIEQLIETYSLQYRKHSKYPNLIQLMYDQLDTPKNDITNNCRGLIIDTDTLEVISFPFIRFDDYDPDKPVVDFDNCTFWHKLDGSIMTVYWYKDAWHVASKGMPDASGKIKNLDITMNDYFWEVWKAKGYEYPTSKRHCYIFELTRPSEDFLVKTTKPEITFIGCRSLNTFNEIAINEASRKWNLTWTMVVAKPKATLTNILKELVEVDPILMEGYVACDSNFNRVKMKSPQYEEINMLRTRRYLSDEDYEKKKGQIQKDNFRRMCGIVRTNQHKSFLKLDKYKEHVELYERVYQAHIRLKQRLLTLFKWTETLSGKELGLKLQSNKELSGIVFAYQKGVIQSLDDYLRAMPIKRYESLLQLK